MIIIANIISFFSNICILTAGYVKKGTLIWQNLSYFLMMFVGLFLNNWLLVLVQPICILKNYLIIKEKINLPLRLALSLGVILLSLFPFKLINVLAILSMAPLFFVPNDDTIIKKTTLFTNQTWMIYSFCVKNYASGIFMIISTVTLIIGLIRIKKAENTNQLEII